MPEETIKKGKNKKLIIALICLAVIALAVGGFLLSRSRRHPLHKMMDAWEATGKALKASPLGSLAGNLSQCGSLAIRADFNEMQELLALAAGSPIKVDAEAEITWFAKEGGVAMKADTRFKGNSLLDTLLVYNEGKELALSSKALFGETSYGLDLKNLIQNLEGSIFDPAKKGWYALPSDFYEQLQRLYANQPLPALHDLRDKGQEVLASLRDRAVEYLIEHADFDTGDRSITLGGDSLKASALTVSMNEESFCGLLKLILHYFREDKAVGTFLHQLFAKFGPLWSTDSPEKLAEDFLEQLKELEENLPEIEESMKGASFVGVFYTVGGKLIRVDLKVNQKGDEIHITGAIGPDPAKPKEIILECRSAKNTVFSINYSVSARSAREYIGKLTLHSYGDPVAEASINWNKESGALSLEARELQSEHSLSLKANLQQKDKLTTLALEELSVEAAYLDREKISLKGISLELNEEADFPGVGSFTELALMSEEEFETVLTDLQKTLGGLLGGIQGALPFP